MAVPRLSQRPSLRGAPREATGDRVRLIGRATLAAFVLVLGFALVLLLPSSSELENLSTTAGPTELSLQHLKALAAANPKDEHLRLLLARALFSTGDIDGAEQNLADIVGEAGDLGLEARKLAMKIAITRFRAHTPGTDEEAVARAIRVAIADPLDATTLEEAAKAALEIGRPRFAIELYERLAREDPEHRAQWRAESARWHLADGRQVRAAELYAEAADESTEPIRKHAWALAAVDAAESAGRPDIAHQLAEHFLEKMPDDPQVLERALRFAVQTGKIERARQLGRVFVREQPNQNDPDALEAQTARELAGGDRAIAIALLKRLEELHPDDVTVHARLGDLYELVGEHELAYEEYRWLVDHGQDEYLDRAIALAKTVYDADGALALRIRRARRADASEQHILDVVQAYEDVGDPDAAAKFLRDRLAAGGGSRALWKRLAILEEQRGAPAGAIDAWKHIQKAWGLDGAEAMHFASLLWRVDKLREGLDVLVSVKDGAPHRDNDYWQQMGDLAWELNDRPVARRAYRELLARGVRDVGIYERLAAIEQAEERYADAAKYAGQAYKVTGETRMLFLAVDLLQKIGDDEGALALLSDAAKKDKSLTKLETYWARRGAVLQRLGEVGEACRAFDEALRLDPASVEDYASALACAVEKDDKLAIEKHVARWNEAMHGSPATYPTYALALVKLHRDREAVVYMIRHLKTRPNDYMWLLELADTVERLGDYAHAYRLRRHALLKLYPHALAALRAKKLDANGRQALLARAMLARHLEGPEASYKWLEPLMPKGEGKIVDAQAADLAVSYYLADGNTEAAKRILLRSRAARTTTSESDRNARLTLALLENNVADIERLLVPPADGQSWDPSRIEALVRTGHDAEAINAIDSAIAAGDAEIDRNTIRDLRGERADVEERIAPTLKATYKLDAYGSLLVEGPQVAGMAYWNKVRIEADAQMNSISSSAAALPVGSYQEYQAALGARYRTLRSNTRLSLGANSRAGVTSPQGVLSHAQQVTDRVSARAEIAVQSVPVDTPVIRAGGVRDAATAEAGVAVSTRDRVELSGTAFQERTIHQDAIGRGGLGTLTVSHKLLHVPEWSVLASGAVLGRSLDPGAQAAVGKLAVPPSSLTRVRDLVPTSAYVAAVGTRLENGDPTSPWGRASFPRYSVSLTGGRIWPQDQWMVEARAAVGSRVFGDDLLGASGYFAYGLVGAGTEAFRGVALYYAHGI